MSDGQCNWHTTYPQKVTGYMDGKQIDSRHLDDGAGSGTAVVGEEALCNGQALGDSPLSTAAQTVPEDSRHASPAGPTLASALALAQPEPEWDAGAEGAGVAEMFEAQVGCTPEAVAVEFQGQCLTYRELNRRANQLAHYLRGRGVGPEALVGICIWRSLDTPIAVLGVLKAGGAYVPLDPLYPRERLAFMIEDARVPVLLTHREVLPCLPEHGGHVLCLDADWNIISQEREDNPIPLAGPDNLAYVIYTSGSTGKPKGVQVLRRGLVNILDAMRVEPGVTAQDVWLSVTTLSFDIATLELLLPLVAGARVVLGERGLSGDGVRLAQALDESRATILQATPATWRLLVQAGWKNGPVRKAFSGGEALPRTLANQLLDQGVALWNLYGPTETTIYSTGQKIVSREGPVPIGRPVANTQAYVLDADLRPLPPGEPGELYLGGSGLARGYLNRPEQTAAGFISDPFSHDQGARLYRTGDLCRWLPDGTLEYLGRMDHQVKIRGYRIELGEIEAALATYPGIREALVGAREDVPGDKRLVAYLITDPGRQILVGNLRAFLKDKLPGYMVPSAFVFLDAFPLTPNGKVDRQALPSPQPERPDLVQSAVAPRNDREKRLAKIWEDVLRVQSVGVRDDFFELGGESILAAQMLARVRDEFGQTLPMSTLLQGASVEYLAQLLDAPEARRSASSLVPIQPHGSKRPIFCVHGIGGEILRLVPLAQHLGPDQPFYALRALGTDGVREPLTRIEDMAAHYLAEILAVQPQGPFLLTGMSFGSLVAFEMAQQLVARGHRVGLLAILDQEFVDAYRAYVWQPKWLFRLVKNLPRWLFRDYLQSQGHWRSCLAESLGQVKGQLGAMYRFPQGGPREWGVQQLPPDMSHLPPAIRQVWRANHQAMMSYAPRPYPGQVLVIRAWTQPLIATFEPDLGWGRFAAGGVQVRNIPGFHNYILDEPYVRGVAKELRRALAVAQASV